MRSLFSRPYRFADRGTASWRNALVFGGFIFLFLLVFQPFGLSAYRGSLWKVALGYGATCAAVMFFLNGLVVRFLPGSFSERDWTVGREIGWTLLSVALIGLANLFYSVAIGFGSFSARMFFWFEAYTVMIGVFPVAVTVLWNEARLSRRYRQDSEVVNAGMQPIDAQEDDNAGQSRPADRTARMIMIPSESGREDLSVQLDQLLFIRSAGNYLEVFQTKGSQFDRQVMRGSLKRTEEALAGHPRLLRCHKSHLVNLDRVARVSGNAQGFQLHLDHGQEVVPVSRRLNDQLGELLAVRH